MRMFAVAVALVLGTSATQVFAHHPFGAEFDATKPIKLREQLPK
jgi:hypothetical protein